ncbi:polysaccharide biosynthesis tyrosine autokinase [Methylosinus sporium]|uniref:non-specific protein-tyrosine kinase n=1 Tax=Methylosinus sporium TaxID=428 RepID=A0A549T1W1_METSR|nr:MULTISPECIES: polysaccharide biosynthesis tyrosine autokinase [Methylosinus]MBU3890940.1 polysaccharide biosynthesis tyrosine autokinase [Methylosinus sp. KRF6]TRL35855.1 polysaccharide biosynthesis tyrosine autokinase [Methylosinus sporium]
MKVENGPQFDHSGLPSASAGAIPTHNVTGLQLLASNLTGASGNNDFNIAIYWQLLLRHIKLIASVVSAFAVLALFATLLKTPIYRATAVIQIERHETRFTQSQGLETGEEGGRSDAEFYRTQYDLLQSRSLAEQVAVRLGLLDDPRFLPPQSPGLTQRLWGVLSRGSSEVDALTRRRAAVAKFTSNLVVEPKRGSRLVMIHYFDPDPSMAQLIVNGVADVFTSRNLERRFEASTYARSYLDERLQELKGKLEKSEAEVIAYGAREQLMSAGVGENKSTLASVNLATANTNLTNAKIERTKLEQLWAIAQTDNVNALPQVLDNKGMSANREKRASLAAEYQQKASLLKPSYPVMVALRSQMDELDRQASKIITVVKDSIRTQYLAAKNQEVELEKQLEQFKSNLINEQARAIQYDMLQREVATNRILYEQMLQRAKEISVLGAVGSNNISVIDPAERPSTPYSPKLFMNLLVGALVGLICGIVAALIIEYLDNTVRSPQDVETRLGLTLLGLVPAAEDEASIMAALQDRRSNVSEALRSLKTALQFSSPDGLPKSLAITSARPKEGKSTTSFALARICAEQGMHVLLIDADLRRPSLHQAIGLSSSVGLSSYLAGAMQASEVVQRTDVENLFFIASGPLPPNPADLFSGPKFSSLISLGGEFFDLIIVDAPPVLGLADAPLIANATGETIFVISAGETRRDVVGIALKRLGMARAHLLGAVLNRFRLDRHPYGQVSGYDYNYGYETDVERDSPQLDHSTEPATAR